jgi:hypothetical protein
LNLYFFGLPATTTTATTTTATPTETATTTTTPTDSSTPTSTTIPSDCQAVPSPAWSLGCTIRAFNIPEGFLTSFGSQVDEPALAREDCAAKCDSWNWYQMIGRDPCLSFVYTTNEVQGYEGPSCFIYATDAWATIDLPDVQHGSQFKENVLDDLACFTGCPHAPPDPRRWLDNRPCVVSQLAP